MTVALLPRQYAKWWLAFRATTDESSAIRRMVASAIDSRLTVLARQQPWALLDVGCGNGGTTTEVLRDLQLSGIPTPSRLVLLDPLPWVTVAARRCRDTFPRTAVVGQRGTLQDFLRTAETPRLPQVALLIHSAYYLDPQDIDELYSHYASLGLIVVIDSVDSVFGDVWRTFNPAMYGRLRRLHQWLDRRATKLQRVAASIQIPSEPHEPSQPHADDVLSFLALRDVRHFSILEKRDLLRTVCSHRAFGGDWIVLHFDTFGLFPLPAQEQLTFEKVASVQP